MQPVTSRRAQVARLRKVALAALDGYALPEGRLIFVSHGENTTFRHDSTAGRHLVRVHRPQRHGPEVDPAAAVRSELAWLRAIRAGTDLSVPEPLTAADGALTVEASASGETRVCSVLRWMDGRLLERSARPVHLHLGNALFHHGGVRLIDFDDCGLGPRIYELAVAVWELRDEPDYASFRDALLEGYRTHRELDVTHLDDFIAVRQVAFDLWFTGMAQVNPAFAARLDVVHRWSLSMLDRVEGSPA